MTDIIQLDYNINLMSEKELKRKKDNTLAAIIKHPLAPLAPGMILFFVGIENMDSVYDRLDENAYNRFPDVASGQEFIQAKHELDIFHQKVDEQVLRGNLIVNVSEIADQQRIEEDLRLLAEQEVRVQDRNNFRENLRPAKDKGFLAGIAATLGGVGLVGLAAVRALRSSSK